MKAFSIKIGRRCASKWSSWLALLHVFDDVITEFAALDLGRAFLQAREIIGDAFAGDRAVESLLAQIGSVFAPHVTTHHFAGKTHRAWVLLFAVGVLGGRRL